MSCFSVGQSLTKSYIGVAVSGRVCEQSGASTISPPRSEHLIITPLRVHHFPLCSSLTDIRNTALHLKYFNIFKISPFCSSHIKKIKQQESFKVTYWNISVQTFFTTTSTWQANNMVVSIIIAAFCSANFVYDKNNYVLVCYFTYGLTHFLQILAHSKSDTDEVAL